MKVYYCYRPEDGMYLGSIPASGNENALPPDFSTTTPPTEKEGHWPVWQAKKGTWKLVEDHRGMTAWKKDLSGFMLIETLGPIPVDFTLSEPPQPKPGHAIVYYEPSGGWVFLEDHRGCCGYVGSEPMTIDSLGPLPGGWEWLPPVDPVAERRKEIEGELSSIDSLSIRATRAIVCGNGTTEDEKTVKELETRAVELREELAALGL